MLYSTVLTEGTQFEFAYHPDEKSLEGWVTGSLYSRRVPFDEATDDFDTATDTLIRRLRETS